MPASSLVLDDRNHATLATWLDEGAWVVACLCAAWCTTCSGYRAGFDELAALHPDKRFVWIDIEDQADVIGDIEVENFPTLLMQRGETVAFLGTVLPDTKLAHRLILAQAERTDEELRAYAGSTPERAEWQRIGNLRKHLPGA